jgi:Lytic transglycolase
VRSSCRGLVESTAEPRPIPSRGARALVAFALAGALATGVVAAPAAAADQGDDALAELVRTSGDLSEVRRLVELHEQLDQMLDRFVRLEGRLGRARLESAQAFAAAHQASAAVDAAKARLDARVRSAYQLGTGAQLEAILGAESLPDLAAVAEFAARAIAVDDRVLQATVVADAVATTTRARAEAERVALEPRTERLRSLLDRMQADITEATILAEQAKIDAEALAAFEEQQRAIAEAATRTGSWDLGVIDYQQDQSHLLALLGPTGGRTCDTPEGLVATGRTFSGYATWYGWEFGGNPTATGAIFDPTLFTAANRWLPFGTFLRVRNGSRCAIVLVNDRGPYGNEERVIDLSMAAAQYLGVGVTWVDAEILVPADAIGG